VHERAFWNDYQQAYEDAINETAAPHAPWFAVPADDKKTMRLIVAQAVLTMLQGMDMKYPEVSPTRADELRRYRDQLLSDD
jgi:polyphosphate kinase 2 (PPK2 family)